MAINWGPYVFPESELNTQGKSWDKHSVRVHSVYRSFDDERRQRLNRAYENNFPPRNDLVERERSSADFKLNRFAEERIFVLQDWRFQHPPMQIKREWV